MDAQPVIPGYRDLEIIGRGGFATVYLARQDAVDRRVAIKVLHRVSDARARRRFVNEARALGALSWHPNIVVVHDAGETAEGVVYLVMEYLPAGTLAHAVDRSGPLSPARVAEVGSQLADALAAAHRVGVIHRDVKPANVLLDHFGTAKLADFGLARSSDVTEATTTGVVTATVVHAPPEVLEGEPATPASDLYSLGSTLFTVAAGRPPFAQEPGEPYLAVVRRVVDQPAPDLTSFGGPPPLVAVVAALLAKEPGTRPSDAAQVARQLRAVADQLAGDGVGATVPIVTDEPAPPEVPSVAPPARGASMRSLGRVAIAAAAGVLVLAGIVVAWRWLGDGDRRANTGDGADSTDEQGGAPGDIPTAVTIPDDAATIRYVTVPPGDPLVLRSGPSTRSSALALLANGTSGVRATGPPVRSNSTSWLPVTVGDLSGFSAEVGSGGARYLRDAAGIQDEDAAHQVMAEVGYPPTGEGVWDPDDLSALEGAGLGGEHVFFFARGLYVGLDGTEPDVNHGGDAWVDNAATSLTIVEVDGATATVRYDLYRPDGSATGDAVDVTFVLDQVPIRAMPPPPTPDPSADPHR